MRARKKETERESAIHTHTHTSTCSGCIVILFRYYSTDEASVAVVVIGSNILPVPHSHFGSSPFPFFFYYYFLVVFFSFFFGDDDYAALLTHRDTHTNARTSQAQVGNLFYE